MDTKKTIETVLNEQTDSLMAIDGVFGLAIGMIDDERCIQIHISSETDDILMNIPKEIEGYKVCPIVMDPPSLFNE